MKKIFLVVGVVAGVFIFSCKKWDSHIEANSLNTNKTLTQQIADNPGLSLFSSYLAKTGVDSLLNSSKNFTVFAPDNDALKHLPDSVSSNMVNLKAFILNLISGKAYFSRDESDSARIAMLNGKRVAFGKGHFDDAAITQADVYAKNGVLHIINDVVLPLPNIWEFINRSKNDYLQNKYIASLNFLAQDPDLAEVDSINPQTGEPVYKPNTGVVNINTYRSNVYDIANEDSLYTYILLTDSAFDKQQTALAPYFKSGNADTTANNASWTVVRDLTIKGMVSVSQLPATLLSKFGVPILIDQGAVVSSQRMSNGMVYVVNISTPSLTEKIPTVYVQGENPIAFSSTSASLLAKIFYRERINPVTAISFNDIYMNLGSSGANFYADYSTNGLYTTKYKVYWVALNDYTVSGQGDDAYGSTDSLYQILQVRSGDPSGTILFNETGVVAPDTYTETYIGEFTNDSYDWLLSYPVSTPDGKNYLINPATRYMRLQAPASVSNKIYNLTLDYVKFVPVFN